MREALVERTLEIDLDDACFRKILMPDGSGGHGGGRGIELLRFNEWISDLSLPSGLVAGEGACVDEKNMGHDEWSKNPFRRSRLCGLLLNVVISFSWCLNALRDCAVVDFEGVPISVSSGTLFI